MICDFDDYSENLNHLGLLRKLREINPEFRCTVFAIPALGTEKFWARTPEWIELAVHGWRHPHSREAQEWTYAEAMYVFAYCQSLFTHGFKAPGWQISDETYLAAMEFGWWVADHWDNDARRPEGLLTHRIAPDYRTNGDHWHGHIPNVEGNGIEETWDELVTRVEQAETFEFVSEAVEPWNS